MSRISDLAGFTTAISTTEDLSVGIITASTFSGNLTGNVTGTASLASNLTGTPDITVTNISAGIATLTGAISATNGTFSGNVNIGGTLTYQDVEHIDSVGIITAQQGIQVLANGLDITGVSTFKSSVSIADSIFHTGDTDTAVRFPSANTVTVETAGGEAIRVDAGRRLLVGTDSSANYGGDTGIFQINGTTNASMALKRSTDNATEPTIVLAKSRGSADSPTVVNSADVLGGIRFAGYDGSDYVTQGASILCAVDGTPGSNDLPGRLVFNTTADGASTPSERVRIDSSGKVGININNPGSYNSAGNELVLGNTGNNGGMTIVSGTGNNGHIFFADGTGTPNRGIIKYEHANDAFAFNTADNERLRITSTGGVHFNNAELIERINVTSGKLSDNQNIDLEDGMAHLFTTTETTTATPNIRVNSTTSLNSVMATGDVISVSIITTTAAAGYAASITIDGTGETLRWNGGDPPSAGGSGGNDFYSYSIIKTADAEFTILANVANFD